MRPIFYLFILTTLILLTACGGGTEATTGNGSGARPTKTIRLLTWRYLPQDREWVKKFEERYNVGVDVTVKPVGEIIRTAQAKQTTGSDLILLPSIEDAVRLREFRALQPFFVNAFTNGDVADNYLDNEGYYAGLSRWTMTAVFNPNAVAQAEAETYLSFGKLPLRGIRVGLAHPDSSGLAGVVAGLIETTGPDAGNVWSRIMYERAEGLPQGSDADQLDRMLAGQLDAALVSSGAAVRWFLNGDPRHFKAAEAWRMKYPKTTNGGINFFNMTCVTMDARAPNRELALTFVNYLFSKPVQEAITASWFEYPAETFTEPDTYLLGIYDIIGQNMYAEQFDKHLGSAWTMINNAAAAGE